MISYVNLSIDSLTLCENRSFLQVYSDSCTCKIVDKQMIIDDHLLDSDEN